ncbi:MAG: hypothetical protein SGILL_005732, partial [Bacillariaceae sp.]
FFLYYKTGLYKTKLHIYYKSFIPGMGIFLILCVVASYYLSLRSIVVGKSIGYTYATPGNLSIHDFIVAYLGIMIIYNFVSACFISPGAVVPKDAGGTAKIDTNDKDANYQRLWKSVDSQGG